MKIILVGFMGCGKTTVGKKLAKALHCSFIDTDTLFEKLQNTTIIEFFATQGEEKFREIEQELLYQIINENENIVISTGGGTPCNFNNMEMINKNGISIYLKMSVASLTSRLLYSYKKRPLIEAFEEESELKNYIEQTLQDRESVYNKAHYTIKGESVNIEALIELIKKESKLLTAE